MSAELNISDYFYDLPPGRIAEHPLKERDTSRLLVYNAGSISHKEFKSIVDSLPANSLLLFNDTRVIPARIHFKKETGATIEIFLLNPVEPSKVMMSAMNATGSSVWACTIGNLKRWPKNTPLIKVKDNVHLEAKLISRDESLVEFNWKPEEMTFAEVVEKTGATPLPPYIKREVEEDDSIRYQTIYSHYDGAVAAPTAGLHFSERILKQLEERGFKKEFVTLHVSAGTFQPIKVENAENHEMHSEQIVISKSVINAIMNHDGPVIPVGTTSMRTIESLYWYGVKLKEEGLSADCIIGQDFPYQTRTTLPTIHDSLAEILRAMDKNQLSELVGHTSIFIRPGYTFRLCKGLITNFHLPGSTLILLVAAFIGNQWKNVYQAALDNNYRFLSYGDSSLLMP